MEAMLQTAKTVTVLRTDIADTIQSILLDDSIRPGLFLMETKQSQKREYVDEDGTPLRGTSSYHGTMWGDLRSTIPDDGGVMLAVIVHTDGVESCGASVKPISIQLGNFPLGDGCGDRRIRCFGLGQDAPIRVPRGTTIPESLSTETAAMKATLKIRSMTDALTELEAMAEHGADFWVRNSDNVLIRVKMYPRLLIIQADMAEQQALLGIATSDCHLCFGHQWATRDQRGAAENRPNMCMDAQGYCATAEKRTVLSVAARQAAVIRVARTKTKGDAEELQKQLGVKYLVENSLARLCSLIRHEVGGPYGNFSVDLLHAMKTGAVPKMCRIWDSCSIRWHRVTPELNSREDVRHFVDDRLMQLPQQYGKPSFALGFWSGDGVGSIKGEEVTTLLELLAVIFCGCDLLIQNKPVRLELLSLTRTMLVIIKEAYTPQWYSHEEDGAMAVRVRGMVQSMHKVMDFITKPDGTLPKSVKHAFDCPKIHALQATAADSVKFGQLANTDTEAGERSQKVLKAANKIVNHNDGGPYKHLLKRIVARQRDAANDSCKKESKRARRHEAEETTEVSAFSSKIYTVGHGMRWDVLLSGLASCRRGPIVVDSLSRQLLSTSIIDATALALCGLQGNPAESAAACTSIKFCETVSRKCVSKHVSRYNFKSGHCVLTNTGRIVQLLVPMVAHVDAMAAGRGNGDDTQCVVYDFEPVDPSRPLYPELPVPLLRRGKVLVMHVINLVRRVHLCPLFGNVHRKKQDNTKHFILNTLGDPYFEGPPDRHVFLRCNYLGCIGTLPQPDIVGSVVMCNLCGHTKQWF